MCDVIDNAHEVVAREIAFIARDYQPALAPTGSLLAKARSLASEISATLADARAPGIEVSKLLFDDSCLLDGYLAGAEWHHIDAGAHLENGGFILDVKDVRYVTVPPLEGHRRCARKPV